MTEAGKEILACIRVIHRLGPEADVTNDVRNRFAFRMGVDVGTVHRWLTGKQAPGQDKVQMARMMAVIARTCPSMLASLQVSFWDSYEEIVGEPLRLASEPSRRKMRDAVREGVDVEREEGVW